jgi:predicted transcriptional regulator
MGARSGPREMTPKQVVLHFFEIKEPELTIYQELLRNGPATSKDLSMRMGKDRSPVYKTVTKLYSCGLVEKVLRKRGDGGLFYVYAAVDPDRVQDMLWERIEGWYDSLKCSVRKASTELKKGT